MNPRHDPRPCPYGHQPSSPDPPARQVAWDLDWLHIALRAALVVGAHDEARGLRARVAELDVTEGTW